VFICALAAIGQLVDNSYVKPMYAATYDGLLVRCVLDLGSRNSAAVGQGGCKHEFTNRAEEVSGVRKPLVNS
jgi:hypothetical protein